MTLLLDIFLFCDAYSSFTVRETKQCTNKNTKQTVISQQQKKMRSLEVYKLPPWIKESHFWIATKTIAHFGSCSSRMNTNITQQPVQICNLIQLTQTKYTREMLETTKLNNQTKQLIQRDKNTKWRYNAQRCDACDAMMKWDDKDDRWNMKHAKLLLVFSQHFFLFWDFFRSWVERRIPSLKWDIEFQTQSINKWKRNQH